MLDSEVGALPIIVHWGADLGDTDDAVLRSLAVAARPQRVSGGIDLPTRASLLPLASQGWQHEPGLAGSRRGGVDFTPAFTVIESTAGDDSLVVVAQDQEAGLRVRLDVALGASGVLRQRLAVTNTGADDYVVASLQATFPLPATAREILDTTGRHLKERSPQRHAFTVGEHVRSSRRGRPGADATLLVWAGETGFGFRSGTVHGVHPAWSGDHRIAAIRTSGADAVLVAGSSSPPARACSNPVPSTRRRGSSAPGARGSMRRRRASTTS